MKRRKFICNLLLSGGAIGLGAGCGKKTEAVDPLPSSENRQYHPIPKMRGTILEPARQIPVLAETDVLVIGGGPAGSAAAIAASRTGVETYLVERYNHLGGLWTGGMVLPLMATHAVDRQNNYKQVIQGIGGEISNRLKNLGMTINDVEPVIDPEAGKYVLNEMIRESGIKMLYHTWGCNVIMDGNTIKGVLVESKSGRMAVLAKIVIDCTGDGDIFYWAGEQYDEMKYHIGLVHRLGNIDRIDKTKNGDPRQDLGLPTPIPGVNWVNMYGEDNQDGLDIINLSRLQMEYQRRIWENTQKIRRTPGYEQVFLLDTASQLGVRMSRILDAEYKLTLDDVMSCKTFEDAIGVCGAGVSMDYKGKKVSKPERSCWQVPLRSLVPRKTENLLVAGRCFSFERTLVEDTRLIGPCLITGQGAGAAAGLAVIERQSLHNLDKSRLKKLLLQQGVWLG